MNDWSEPIFALGCIVASASTVVSGIVGTIFGTVTGALMMVSNSFAYLRVRKLGLSRSIQESAEHLGKENEKLRDSCNTFRLQIQEMDTQLCDFKKIVKLLDGTEQDLQDVEKRLRSILYGIESENKKSQNNNLCQLFTLIDTDRDGVLNQSEVHKLKEYVEVVYQKNIDFDILDTNQDKHLTLPEFIKMFKN